MKCRSCWWMTAATLLLALPLTEARAAEESWGRSAVQSSPAAPPAVSLGRPIRGARSSQPSSASLGRPIALPANTIQLATWSTSPQQAQTSATGAGELPPWVPQLTVRAQAPTESVLTLNGPPPVPPPGSDPGYGQPPGTHLTLQPPAVPPPADVGPPLNHGMAVEQPINRGFWNKCGDFFQDACQFNCQCDEHCYWVGADFLAWWIKSDPVRYPLVTTSVVNPAMALPFPGSLADANARILSSNYLTYPMLPGARIYGGIWTDPSHALGFDFNGFLLSQRGYVQSFQAGPGLYLARPFIAAGVPNALPVTFPAPPGLTLTGLPFPPYQLAGGVKISSTTSLGGLDTNVLTRLYNTKPLQVDLFGGFRFLDLNEKLEVSQYGNLLPPAALAPVLPSYLYYLDDQIKTSNQFYGGQIGARVAGQYGRFALGMTGKLGIGGNVQSITINGSNTIPLIAGFPILTPGGLYSGPGNIGQHGGAAFSLVPELDVDFKVFITSRLALHFGYNLIFWTNVVRPGQQIDPVQNPPNQPGVLFHNQTLWLQGLSVGMVYEF